MQLDTREGYLRAFVSGVDSLDVSLAMWRMAREHATVRGAC